MSKILPVILAGGFGERLWPLSRQSCPKQFVTYCDEFSLFQLAVKRFTGELFHPPLVICNEKHKFLVAEQIDKIGAVYSAILLESSSQNTAPAITVAALWAQKYLPEAPLLVSPADHEVKDPENLEVALPAAVSKLNDCIITFGITPTGPETVYGYIKRGSPVNDNEIENHIYHVDKFVEKPELKVAEKMIQSGEFLWNSGLFLFKAETFLAASKKHVPEVYEIASSSFANVKEDSYFKFLDSNYSESPKISVDYGIIEKISNLLVCELQINWSDLGNWNAIYNTSNKDSDNNHTYGNVIAIDTHDCLIQARDSMIATLGVDNLAIIETDDAILVIDRQKAHEVGRVVSVLKSKEPRLVESSIKAIKPWGSYSTISKCDRYQVKRLLVNPGCMISIQMHHHRSEHWIIVKGTALVICGGNKFILSEDQHTFIPIGEKHCIENIGKIPLEFIEVQYGSYLEEDDIVRFSDKYGRKTVIA